MEVNLNVARLIGNGVVAAHFIADKPKARIAALVNLQKAIQSHLGKPSYHDAVTPLSAILAERPYALRPFHWPIEFPEVFSRVEPGFDAIIGNPPFAGKNTITAGNRDGYLSWLQTLHPGAHGNADLVAHFFRRAFALLRDGCAFGLIATNTIGQGDTRDAGLAAILSSGGAITRATRRLKWPGDAAVVVSVIHVIRGAVTSPVLNERQVRRVSAYLSESDLDRSPERLAANSRQVFKGSELHGPGFLFDDNGAEKGECEPLSVMKSIIEKDQKYLDKIRPFLTGEDVVASPTHETRRFAIDVNSLSLDELANEYPLLFDIIDRRVRPQRKHDKRLARKNNWWRYGERSSGLYNAIQGLNELLCTTFTSPHMSFANLENKYIFSNMVIVFTGNKRGKFSTLQSRIHEVWTRFFASTLEDRLRYTPSDCFETFPVPPNLETVLALEAAGLAYQDHRAALMVTRNEGMTKTYNRFHDRVEQSADIQRLRDLHAEMDRSVLAAYGWDDLAACAEAQWLDDENESEHTYQGRLFWPSAFRDEVLGRLLALNAQRAAAERAVGLVAGSFEEADDFVDLVLI